MTSSNQGKVFLRDIKDFVNFLKNLWGVLTGISIFFPLSNALIHIIPIETFVNGGVLIWFSPALFTTLATIVSLFLIFWMFGQRQKFQSQISRARIQREAWITFAVGIGVLLLYLVSYFILSNGYDLFGWKSDDIIRLLGEVPLLILYGAFFALITRAFTMLGMSEYFRHEKQVAKTRRAKIN
jgi:hypothetical protein